MKHSQNPQWDTLFIVQIWVNGQLTWTMHQKSIKYLSTQGLEFWRVDSSTNRWGIWASNLLWRIIYSQSRFWYNCRAGLAFFWKTQGEAYCFYCKLFGTGQNSFITGFNDWNMLVYILVLMKGHRIIVVLLEYSCRDQLPRRHTT